MYMLIPMDFIILGNYVYVDSTGFLNACKLCVHSTGFLNACKLCWFGILVNTVYVYANGFLNACKLCICWLQWIS